MSEIDKLIDRACTIRLDLVMARAHDRAGNTDRRNEILAKVARDSSTLDTAAVSAQANPAEEVQP